MCEPTTIALLVVAAAGALASKDQTDRAVVAQAEANNSNTRESYRVAQEADRANKAQAFEATTDRMRDAQRKLSMARVVAAEGGGSLAANAINITAGAGDDLSRIDAGVRNQASSVRDTMAAAQTSNKDALATAQVSLQNNQTKFLTDIASAGAGAYVGSENRASQKKLAQHYAADYKLKKD